MMDFRELQRKYHYILASQSPRRQFLLKDLGLACEIRIKEIPENFPKELKAHEIPLYLCKQKAKAFKHELADGEMLITADTIVWINGQVLNKPISDEEASRMLRKLSGKMHEVYTGVCLTTNQKTVAFHSVTKVFFKTLSADEISYYVNTFHPLDKAGAYGAQEWIGYIGVEKIEGSYFNVMGLPLRELYEELIKF
jgi:septum formation protein